MNITAGNIPDVVTLYHEEIPDEIKAFRYVGITAGLVDIVLGTSGNLLTICAVMRNGQLRMNSFNMFIVNLCVIDFLTAFAMMPFNVAGYFLMEWPFSTQTCILQAFFYFSCGYTSIVCLISITLNRVLGIVFPDRYKTFFTGGNLRCCLFLCWGFAPAFLLPFLAVSLVNDVTGGMPVTGWNRKQLLCTFVGLPGHWRPYMQITRILFQFLPILVMTLSYSVVVYYVRKSHKRLEANSNPAYHQYKQQLKKQKSNQSIVFYDPERNHNEAQVYEPRLQRTYSVVSRISSVFRKGELEVEGSPRMSRRKSHVKHQEREHQLVYLSIIICLTFTLLFLPSVVVNILPNSSSFDPRIHMAASNITWLNSCVNPCIYALLHKRMRKEYKRILKGIYYSFKSCLHFTKD